MKHVNIVTGTFDEINAQLSKRANEETRHIIYIYEQRVDAWLQGFKETHNCDYEWSDYEMGVMACDAFTATIKFLHGFVKFNILHTISMLPPTKILAKMISEWYENNESENPDVKSEDEPENITLYMAIEEKTLYCYMM